jgi:hypothetical protein
LKGYGEGVCYIVNDLTNRELIRRKFKFDNFRLVDEDNHNGLESDEDTNNDTLLESINLIQLSGVKQSRGNKDLSEMGRM